MLPGLSVQVPAVSSKVTVGFAFGQLYKELLQSEDDFNRKLVELFREDLSIRRVLKRDLVQFIVDDQSGHLGVVKAVAMLGCDDRFALRLKKAYWVLVDAPSAAQVSQIKELIWELETGTV